MNVTEGAIRMQRAGRAMAIIGLAAFVLSAITSGIYAFLPASLHIADIFGVLLPAVFTILWIIAAILVIFWIIGLVAHILGAAVHILLVLAIIAFIVGFLTRA